jgi:DNA-3-methyladenine glycosylase II
MQIRSFVSLPANFRPVDVLSFFSRDVLGTSERVLGQTIQKAFMYEGSAAYIEIKFTKKRATYLMELHNSPNNKNALTSLAKKIMTHILGLSQPVEDMEKKFGRHSAMARLLKANAGLRVPQSVTVWEALVSAVIGQQVSVSAATSMRVKFINGLGLRHASGLVCFPGPREVLGSTIAQLATYGLSRQKAQTITDLANQVVDGVLLLDYWRDHFDYEKVTDALISIKGIGWWTVNYALLRGYSYLNGSLHGDAAVRRNLQRLLNLEESPSASETEKFLNQFEPYRALIAAHLWALKRLDGY